MTGSPIQNFNYGYTDTGSRFIKNKDLEVAYKFMKLNEFIKELENISRSVNEADKVEVEMADCIPAVKPILKDNTVFITDIGPDTPED